MNDFMRLVPCCSHGTRGRALGRALARLIVGLPTRLGCASSWLSTPMRLAECHVRQSRATFARRFAQHVGISPAAWAQSPLFTPRAPAAPGAMSLNGIVAHRDGFLLVANYAAVGPESAVLRSR
jgi:hypothetical protein